MIDHTMLENSRKNCTKYLTMAMNENCKENRLRGQFEVALNDSWYFLKLLKVRI